MEVIALRKAIGTLLIEMERVRVNISSRVAKLEEYSQKTRYVSKIDTYIEMDGQAIRKDMREVLREMGELGGKFEMLHGTGGLKDEKLTEEAARLVAGARSLGHVLSTVSATALQVHNSLRSSRLGVLGWNIHHDAMEAEEVAGRIVKACQRVSSSLKTE